ncbi:MAG: T9SS type A sorting domain-containing protein [Saprospiraceae bacterium]|nr:T9SS type A sorting domain-containing protein [Saprospiraceae bacterium]
MKQIAVLFLLFGAGLLAAQTNFRVVGYLPTYQFALLDDIQLQSCTHVNIAFANPDAQGQLTTEGYPIGPVVARAHQQGAKALLSLAGGYLTPEWEAAWNLHLQAANRPAFIQKIVQYALNHQLDGVDVDLEWQYVNDQYSPFVLELKTALVAQDLLLTAALPGGYRYPQISAAALAAFDWINLMVYDLTGPWDPAHPGPHSPYDWSEQCIQYWKNQGVPGSRLTLGVPFYGYDFGSSPVGSFAYRNMVDLSADYAWLDQVGQRFYNGIPTIRAKTQLALDEVSGIMIWALGHDVLEPSQNAYSLLRAIDEVLHPALAAPEARPETLRFSPNPAAGQLRIPGEGPLRLYDPTGRLMVSANAAGALVLDVSDLPAGWYVVQRQVDGQWHSGRLLKQ